MKRLTKRDEYGNADIIGVDSSELQLNLEFEELNKVTDALNRLATYEDTEEEGRLVELPCKVGDTAYFNSYYSKGTLQGEVKAITIDKHGTILTLLTKTKQITRKPIEQVYVSEEEAEKAKGGAV